MFHRIERIQHTGLEKLNKLAYLTVAFGLQCQTNEPEETLKQDFVTYCTVNGYPHAGAWLWGKPQTIRLPLLDLLRQPLTDKQEVLIALTADQNLEQCFHHNRFNYPLIPSLCKTALELVAQILGNFYAVILADGAPGDILGEINSCDRQAVLKAYLRMQKIKVCPACDGMPPSVDDYADKIREDIDHFFPKSKYPFWAIHPLNLTPFCKVCNQTYKGAKDAITDQADDVADVISPECTYHPYLRPARGEIELVVKQDQMKGTLYLRIKPITDDAIHQARIHSLNYLLNLESRWNGDLKAERLQEHIKIGLAYCTPEERDSKTLTDDLIRQKLKLVAATIERSIEKIPGQATAAAYARWLLSDPEAQTERVRLAQQELE